MILKKCEWSSVVKGSSVLLGSLYFKFKDGLVMIYMVVKDRNFK